MELDKVTRLEVIDANGRSYTNWRIKDLELSFQDDGKTLKIFVKEKTIDQTQSTGSII